MDEYVNRLRSEGINVTIVQDQGKQNTPDSIFPNNWISFHPEHKVNLYPMLAPNRRN